MFTRQNYMDGVCSHDEYYGQFVTQSMRDSIRSWLGDKILRSKDPQFKDISLAEWDRFHSWLPQVTAAKRKEAEEGGATLCFSVCVAKQAARQIRGW